MTSAVQTCVLPPKSETLCSIERFSGPLNIKTESLSDFVALDYPKRVSKDLNSPPSSLSSPSSSPSSVSPSPSSAVVESTAPNAEMKNCSVCTSYYWLPLCDYLLFTFRLRGLSICKMLPRRAVVGLLHCWPRKRPWRIF